jgi:hypothetical protein
VTGDFNMSFSKGKTVATLSSGLSIAGGVMHFLNKEGGEIAADKIAYAEKTGDVIMKLKHSAGSKYVSGGNLIGKLTGEINFQQLSAML